GVTNNRWEQAITLADDSTSTIMVKVSDAAGNTVYQTYEVSVNADAADTTAPTLTSIIPTTVQTTGSVSDVVFVFADETAFDATAANNVIEFTMDGTDVSGTQAVSGAGNTVLTLTYSNSALAVGVHNFEARVKDAVGNWLVSSATIVVEAIADTTAPTITWSEVPDSPAQTEANISFKSSETGEARVHYGTTDSYGLVTEWTDVTTNVYLKIALQDLDCDTTYYYSVHAKDASGNTQTKESSFTTSACSDTTAPVISSITTDLPEYRVTQDPNVVITIVVDGTESGVTVNGDAATGGPGTWTYNLAHPGTIGTYSFIVVATDSYGNTQEREISYNVVSDTDTTDPTLNVDGTTPTDKTVAIQVDLSDNLAGNLDVWVDYGYDVTYGYGYGYGDEGVPTYGQGTSIVSYAQGNDQNVYITNLLAGTYYYYAVHVRDTAGNEEVVTGTFTTDSEDIHAPVVTASGPSGTNTDGSVTLTVTTDESATCKYAITDKAYSSMTAFTTTGTTTHSQALSLAEGVHQYYVRCSDGTTEMTTSAIIQFTVDLPEDTTAPTITPHTTPVQSITRTTAGIVFQSSESGEGKVHYGITGSYGLMTTYQSVTANTDKTITLEGLTCGTTYHYTIYAMDASGNEANTTDATFTTSSCPDTTAPGVIASSPSGKTTDDTPEISVTLTTADNVATTTCKYNIGSTFDFSTQGTAMTWNGSEFTATLSEQSDGNKIVYIICQDIAGNLMSSPYPMMFFVDTTGTFSYAQSLSLNWNLLWLPPTLSNITSNTTTKYVLGYNASDYGYNNYWETVGNNWDVLYHYDTTTSAWKVQYGPAYSNTSLKGTGTLTNLNSNLQNPFWIKMAIANRFELD
ncbi:hypothetical protein K9M79_08765, partial [Candidatus Woesearchaeota archaeon]|nr:hypothetical protein [Candidatus Woesearchaeota archaeon]